jgi:peptidyl-prolyl cis-trans isomerase SurA
MSKSLKTLAFLVCTLQIAAQRQVADQVIAVIGKYPVLLSDLQHALIDRETGDVMPDRCKTMEMLVFQKLLVAQADRDSITTTDTEVDNELNRRMAYFIQKFGSEEKLEEFYGKRTNVLKDDFRAEVQDQLLADKMHSKIAGDLKLTPAEVRLFYNAIPADSLPLIDAEVELQQLVVKPVFSAEAKKLARDQIESYRERVVKGQSSMSTLARLYSEDPASAKEGGFYANMARGGLDPAFEAAAFRLKTGEISNVFESAYGYHFIELIQRRGDLLDLRHILVIPKMSNTDFFKCKQKADSIYTIIREGKMQFEDAVKKFSQDNDTKQNGGLMVNPQSASTKWDIETLNLLDKNIVPALNAMQPGELSRPMEFMTNEGRPGFRILKLKTRIDPHKANLRDDYQKLNMMATNDKNKKLVREWIQKRSKSTYIKIDPQYRCKFENDWTLTN